MSTLAKCKAKCKAKCASDFPPHIEEPPSVSSKKGAQLSKAEEEANFQKLLKERENRSKAAEQAHGFGGRKRRTKKRRKSRKRKRKRTKKRKRKRRKKRRKSKKRRKKR